MPVNKGRIIHLESIDSTNTYLKELAKKSEADFGDCVIADRQTAGRGRLGRSFSSVAEKGIYFSYLLDPKGAVPEDISKITAWGAVAVRDAICEFCGKSVQIKWVNDLVYGSKKLCGILTEMTFGAESGQIQSVIMGIGINVNHGAEDFPEELREIATSLKMICGKELDKNALILILKEKIDKLNEDFSHKKEYYLSEYRKSCAVLGKRIRIIKNGTESLGTALDIDDDFGLVVRFDGGEVRTVTEGDVSVRGFYGYI